MRLLFAVIAFASVARADEPDVDVEGRDSTELRGDAMVWEDAPLYLEPWEGGTSVRFATFGRARREEVGRALPVRIVSAARTDFVEVELVDARTCAAQSVRVDPRVTGLHFFVKREDLAPVLAKPFTLRASDGTGVKLRPGLPVVPTASGMYVVSARGDVLRLPIPHASIAFTYTRTKADDPPLPKGPLWRLERTTPVKVADTEMEARAAWLATRPAKHGATVKLAWSTRCIDLVVAAPANLLRPGTRSVEIHGFARGTGNGTHVIPRGTPLSTFGGREVAIAAEAIDVQAPTSDRTCFEAAMTLDRVDGGTLRRIARLCAPTKLVEGPPVAPGVKISNDPLAPPPDVGAPPADAKRTPKGTYWKRLAGTPGGKRPNEDSTVVVHYTGWTTDGTMFDSTHKRGQPARFPLRAVIAGWTDGLQLMSVGDKFRLWIPEDLAYKGAPGPPQGMLVFDVELLSVE